MLTDNLEDVLIDKLSAHFKGAAKDYVVKESTDIPFLQLIIELTVYNYYVIRVSAEKSTIFFSILQSGYQLPLFNIQLSDSELQKAPLTLEKEVRLRIPDKYLQAKGW